MEPVWDAFFFNVIQLNTAQTVWDHFVEEFSIPSILYSEVNNTDHSEEHRIHTEHTEYSEGCPCGPI